MGITRRQFLKSSVAVTALLPLTDSPAHAQARRPMGDVIVLLPGIMGSILRKDGRDVWGLSGSALLNGLKTLGRSVSDLTLSGDSPEAETLGDGITADRVFPDTHLLPGLWKIDGYSTLAKAIASEFDTRPGLNYFELPYDWRRDNRVAARRLAKLAPNWLNAWRQSSGNRDAKLILIAHSMGGLVSRYFLEVLGGWRETRMLITFGTPYRGSLNALNVLANGFKKSLGPLTVVDISSLVRSFTSSYQLLPIYPCYDPGTGQLKRVGEMTDIPNLDAGRAKAALDFHNEIRLAVEQNAKDPKYLAGRYTLHPIVGTYQPTLQIGRRVGRRLDMSDRHPQSDVTGDGTVPQVSAIPIESETLSKQHRTVFVAEVHGSLQNSRPMLDHLRQLLAEKVLSSEAFRAPTTKAISLTVDDLYSSSEAVRVRVRCEDEKALIIVQVSETQTGRQVTRLTLNGTGNSQIIDVGRLPEGTYRVRASGGDGGSVSDVFVVLAG
jgi:lecithin:cholesterol acyltransferase